MTTLCPLCRESGDLLRIKDPTDLENLYANYSKLPLTKELVSRYLTETISEFECGRCLIRWYNPGKLGGADFYEHLGKFPGYYNPNSWDKRAAIRLLEFLGTGVAVDVGCGDGWVLREGNRLGWNMFGTELNPESVESSKNAGLDVNLPDAPSLKGRKAKVLVSLQTLEHVEDPVAWIRSQVDFFDPEYLVLAVPACDTMLGYTSDPLVWPPHHKTLWSSRSLSKLANLIGFQIKTVEYETNGWARFNYALGKEDSRRFWGKPTFPSGKFGHMVFLLLKYLRVPWICRSHSVIALMEVKKLKPT